jgi:hypothetical protein
MIGKIGAIEVAMDNAMTKPRLATDSQKASVSVVVIRLMDQYVVLMHDRNHGCSLTNGAEQICSFIRDTLLAGVPYERIRWIYRDSICVVEEIVMDGTRASFRLVASDDEQVGRAIEVARSVTF